MSHETSSNDEILKCILLDVSVMGGTQVRSQIKVRTQVSRTINGNTGDVSRIYLDTDETSDRKNRQVTGIQRTTTEERVDFKAMTHLHLTRSIFLTQIQTDD